MYVSITVSMIMIKINTKNQDSLIGLILKHVQSGDRIEPSLFKISEETSKDKIRRSKKSKRLINLYLK